MPPARTESDSWQSLTTLSDILFRNRLPDWWETLAQDPLHVIARRAFATCTTNLPLYPSPEEDDPQGKSPTRKSRPTRARVVCISDTHNRHAELPPLPSGDVLIHAGDLTDTGTEAELDAALAWLDAAPHKHKIVVAGNHDTGLQVRVAPTSRSRTKSTSSRDSPNSDANSADAANSDSTGSSPGPTDAERRDALLRRYPSLTYLEDATTTLAVHGRLLCVHGSPRTPLFRPSARARAFQYKLDRHPSHPDSGQGFSFARRLPFATDILVTHGPPADHLDWRPGVGSRSLLKGLRRARPLLHVFGHVHAARGARLLPWSRAQVWYERACQPGLGWARRAGYTLLVVCAAAGTKLGVVRRPGAAVPLARCPGRTGTILVNASSAGGFSREGIPHALQEPIVVDVPLPERL